MYLCVYCVYWMNISSYCVQCVCVGELRSKLVTWPFGHLSSLLGPNVSGPMFGEVCVSYRNAIFSNFDILH